MDIEIIIKNWIVGRTIRAQAELEAVRSGGVNPGGCFSRGGRWRIYISDRRWCCDDILEPSRVHLYSERAHARTRKHVWARYGLDTVTP